MIINYSVLNKILNLKKALYVFFVFLLSQVAVSQCAAPVVGCSNTNLSNFGSDSNNDAATIEYDNFVSSYHATIVRTSEGSLQVWGEKMGSDGNSNVLSPITINSANFPALNNAVPLKAALGSSSGSIVQGILLATDGLYAWSTEGAVLDETITSGEAFEKITINGNPNGLPPGINPGDVKMMFATFKTLVITTCGGDVWVISQTPDVRGNGGTGNATTWYRVTTSANGNPFLTDVVACRGNYDALMALKSDGTVHVWGNNILLGDNNPIVASQSRASQMTLPAAIPPKMIGSSGNNLLRSYYVLATDGNLYTLGRNASRQLGDWTSTERLSWVQPRYTSATGQVMNDIKWFSVQEHDATHGSVNVINSNKNLYAFGQNDYNLLGTTGNSTNPVMPTGLTTADKILAVETGGHTSMIVKNCEGNFGYAGHRVRGSMGNGSNDNAAEAVYTFATAPVQICGVESLPAINTVSTGQGPNSKYCVNEPVTLNLTPAGGTLSIVSGPGTVNGNRVSFTAAGTVVVQYSITDVCNGIPTVTTRSLEAEDCFSDLQVTKTVDNLNASVGNNSVFTITARNNGPYPATGVSVKDVLPAGYTFISAVTSRGTWSAPDWTIGNLANGASETLTITTRVNDSGPYANTAVISGNVTDSDLLNNSATVTPVVEADLSVSKTSDKKAPIVGETIVFTITARNLGHSNATGVSVNDVLPSGYTFVSAAASAGNWSAPNWNIGNFANGASATLTITAIVNPSGSYTNTATITGTQNDPQTANNSSSATPSVNHLPVAYDDENEIPSTAAATAIKPLHATDSDGTIVNYSILSLPVNGVLALNGIPITIGQVLTPAEAANLTYDPSGIFNGNDTFTFDATDNSGAHSLSATITIKVGNNPPTAHSDTNAVIPSPANSTPINPLTATDTDGTIVGFTIVTLPSHGVLTLNGLPIQINQILTPAEVSNINYKPNGDFTGDDTFTFTATDNNGAVDLTPATITIPVGNNPPTAISAINSVIPSTASATLLDALQATDTDGTIANYTIASLPVNGILALNGIAVTVGQILTPTEAANLTYDPNGTFTGNDSFSFNATDNLGAVSVTPGIITIPVGNNPPVAHDGIGGTIPSRADETPVNPLTATDTDGTVVSFTIVTLPQNGTLMLNGTAITAGQILTPAEAANLTYNPNGNFSGNDTFTFTATDNDGAVDLTPATITIVVEKTKINAVLDQKSVVGVDQVVEVLNVLDNDTLENNPVALSEVDLKLVNPDPTGFLTLQPDGRVELAPDAPAGVYTLNYEICEKQNTSNCSPAQVIVNVSAPEFTIKAESYCDKNVPYVSYTITGDNFTPTGLATINWIDSANNVVATQTNMPLNGSVVWPGIILDSNNNRTNWPGWTLINGQWTQTSDGFELTTTGITMQVVLGTTKSVSINHPCNSRPNFAIEANDESNVILADGLNGSLEIVNVLDNDRLNGVAINPSDITINGLNFPSGIVLNPDGTIDVEPSTAGGNYSLTYQICELANTSNCDTATLNIFVEVPAISVLKTVVFNDTNNNDFAEAGETLSYHFSVTNTGNTDLENLIITDPLPNIMLNGGPIDLASGQTDSSSFTATYILTQADISAGLISNQATVSGITKSGIPVSDKSDPSDLNSDSPTIIELSPCKITVHNAVSVDGDGVNERFYIKGIECFPENTVQIFNRWGVLVFEREHYDNTNVVFKGISEGRVTVKDSNGLPEGTYYYILKYKDHQSNPRQEAGYLYLTK